MSSFCVRGSGSGSARRCCGRKDLLNVMVRNNALQIVLTKSVWVWVWVGVPPLIAVVAAVHHHGDAQALHDGAEGLCIMITIIRILLIYIYIYIYI